jgi:hypothetical protein
MSKRSPSCSQVIDTDTDSTWFCPLHESERIGALRCRITAVRISVRIVKPCDSSFHSRYIYNHISVEKGEVSHHSIQHHPIY